jgi:transcription initiation factor IIE alpha subunit
METAVQNRNTAFIEVETKLPKKRKYVYEMIANHGDLSPQKLCDITKRKFNEIAPRFTELRESGHIKILYHATNKETGNNNAWYCITTKDERIEIINRMYQSLIDKKDKMINDLNLNLSYLTKEMVKKEIKKIDIQIKNLDK